LGRNLQKKTKLYFSLVKEYLTKCWCGATDAFASIKDEALKMILEHTMQVENIRREVQDHCEQHRGVRPDIIAWLLLTQKNYRRIARDARMPNWMKTGVSVQ
jgi:hypothetical protein